MYFRHVPMNFTCSERIYALWSVLWALFMSCEGCSGSLLRVCEVCSDGDIAAPFLFSTLWPPNLIASWKKSLEGRIHLLFVGLSYESVISTLPPKYVVKNYTREELIAFDVFFDATSYLWLNLKSKDISSLGDYNKKLIKEPNVDL